MTAEQFKFYLLHPRQWFRWKTQQFEAWKFKRKSRKYARRYMADVRLMEAQLKAAAYPGCPKCYGQGNCGWNMTTKTWVVCRCTCNPNTQANVDAHPWLKKGGV